jgi:hypothetical protein
LLTQETKTRRKKKMANNYETLSGKTVILMLKDLPMEGLTLEEDLQCEYLHRTMLKGTGTVVNLLNNNCTDSAPITGGLRLPPMDVRKVPSYLSRNEAIIKNMPSNNSTVTFSSAIAQPEPPKTSR